MKRQMPTLISRACAIGLCLFLASSTLAQRTFNGSSSSSSGRRSSSNSSRSSSFASSSNTSTDGSKVLGTASIDYDPDTGTVIVFADEETNSHIEKVVTELDRPVPQVLIKVLFLEVTHSNGEDLGVEGILKFNHGNDVNEISTNYGLGTERLGGFYKIIDSDLEATLHAIATTNKLEVLSRPSILTRNNHEAIITVGQEVPFITNSRVTDNGDTINTIQYSDIGIILRVTPHIAPERMVEMQVEPEISTLTADTVPISDTVNARVIAKRSADTRVLVGNGKTVVIGGMMENNNKEHVSKVPLLGDIPYLGALFRRTVMDKSKTELLIFLTPLVVNSPSDLQAMTKSENGIRSLTPKALTKEQVDDFISQPRDMNGANSSGGEPAPNAGTPVNEK